MKDSPELFHELAQTYFDVQAARGEQDFSKGKNMANSDKVPGGTRLMALLASDTAERQEMVGAKLSEFAANIGTGRDWSLELTPELLGRYLGYALTTLKAPPWRTAQKFLTGFVHGLKGAGAVRHATLDGKRLVKTEDMLLQTLATMTAEIGDPND